MYINNEGVIIMNAKIIVKYQKNMAQFLIKNDLNVVIDDQNTVCVPANQTCEMKIEAGKHRLQASFPYLGSEAGKAHIEFEIKDDEVLLITYKTPLLVQLPGKILVQKVK
jgi:hypothetical protein